MIFVDQLREDARKESHEILIYSTGPEMKEG